MMTKMKTNEVFLFGIPYGNKYNFNQKGTKMLEDIVGIIFIVGWIAAAVLIVYHKPEYDKIRKDIKKSTGYTV